MRARGAGVALVARCPAIRHLLLYDLHGHFAGISCRVRRFIREIVCPHRAEVTCAEKYHPGEEERDSESDDTGKDHASSPFPNNPICVGSRGGAASPRCSNAAPVIT